MIGLLYVWPGNRPTGWSAIVARSFLHVWVIRDEIGLRAMAGILVLPRDGLLIMESVERIDTHGSPPIELNGPFAFEVIRGDWCVPHVGKRHDHTESNWYASRHFCSREMLDLNSGGA
jgi:hypothetical protein